MNFDMDYVLSLTEELLRIPSVAGDCREIMDRCAAEFQRWDLPVTRTNKGALIATMEGEKNKARFIGAHADTLGAVVRSIKNNGRLRLLPIGGFSWCFYEGENLWVRTASGKMIRGSLLPDKASRHAFGEESSTMVRTNDTVEVRLDEDVSSPEETRALGIEVGDLVFFDHHFETTASGYIKSRYLDDKICVAVLFGCIKALREAGVRPTHRVYFNISNYEEKGHGISMIPADTAECLSVDIGIVAPGTNSSEKAVTIMARDNKTPYDFAFRKRLTDLAQTNHIPYRVDVALNYASDATMAVTAGWDVNFACIGPGVDASHHYERTHRDAIKACGDLVLSYLREE